MIDRKVHLLEDDLLILQPIILSFVSGLCVARGTDGLCRFVWSYHLFMLVGPLSNWRTCLVKAHREGLEVLHNPQTASMSKSGFAYLSMVSNQSGIPSLISLFSPSSSLLSTRPFSCMNA
jgi:hypothetical protein